MFATLRSKEQAEKVLEFLNSVHPNIQFTLEHEESRKLPFLDTLVSRQINKFSSTIYRKKTFTGVYLHWTSLTARRYKLGLIRCLAERIWRICSEENERQIEFEKLKSILQRNEYPLQVIEKALSKFIESKTRPQPTPLPTHSPPPEQTEKSKSKRFIVLPYVSRKCEDFAHRLKKHVEANFKNVEFNVAFQTPATIGQLFPFKDNIKNAKDKSSVVYKLSCTTCNAAYIGMTERILALRVKEHIKSPESACLQHLKNNPTHEIDYENVEVLDSADGEYKLRVKELLHILQKKPELNKQLGSQSSFNIKPIIIAAYPQPKS